MKPISRSLVLIAAAVPLALAIGAGVTSAQVPPPSTDTPTTDTTPVTKAAPDPTVTCDKTDIVVGSGTAGQANCQLSGYGPNETIIVTQTAGPNAFTGSEQPQTNADGAATASIFSNCNPPDQPRDTLGPFTIAFTGQTSGLSASFTFNAVGPDNCPQLPAPSAAPPVVAGPRFTG